MKRNPFTKSVDGIGPGPGDMAQARIRAMATIDRQNEQAKIDSESFKEPVRRGYSPQPLEVKHNGIPDTSLEREGHESISRSKPVKLSRGFRWMQRLWTARG